MLLTVLADAYWEDTENNRTVMKLHPKLAPVKAVVCPLTKKDGLPELARKITDDLKTHYKVIYDQQGSIGKRYYRQDEAGTPFGITIDHQSLEDNTVTLRSRDTQNQERISFDSLIEKIDDCIHKY
jgi:glycyl-tRNA synthetase